ncbi:GNAT family N-acetyltransferase [Nicoliella spurrieriana]|uniref:GNAT family N-acetyltransferase n=1 Tax=Nicoliella spurrieriana TaxID=2925830 RepID=A0A976RSY6_9LACO|nr:GNAT family N-acetyltransferase [Nicoliella spurrieriana]UQS87280.1 GNAT family N-acetyltransferase [Nicoliella spurrieriana]
MADIYTRPGRLTDLPAIMAIIAEAKRFLSDSGSPQWQDGYPDESTLRNDIENGTNYVLIDGGQVAGTATLLFITEPSYHDIDGAWQNDDDRYATIHRIAIASQFRGHHLSNYFFANLITIAAVNNIHNVRFDTHRLNVVMQSIGKHFNFQYRGIIEVNEPRDPKRLAYELNM